VAFLDAYGRANGNQSRSAILHLAIFVFRGVQLTSSHEAAWSEWAQTAEANEWSAVGGVTGSTGAGPGAGSGSAEG
jgi:hypothetical protein